MGESVGVRAKIQKFGGVLSGMVMPNIGAFITWGLITAMFLETGWFPNETLAALISPMLTYLLPVLIGYTGGRNVYGDRGGVIGATATMGVIVGSDIPMFMGAMIMGPLAAICMKKVDSLFEGRIKPGFEMIVNNFSCGILGIFLVLAAFFGIGPLVQVLNNVLTGGVNFIIDHGWTPFASIFIEPAKVLFLNNAINHGILGPIGISQAAKTGKSILFILEPNPGPGVGVLLAYTFFGKGTAKKTAPGVAIIHAFGGIHEPYFPYILMKPQMILAAIAGAVSGNFIFQTFNCGLVSTASPGSIFSVLAVAAKTDYLPISLGMFVSGAVSLLVGAVILKLSKDSEEDGLELAVAKKNKMKSDGQAGGPAGTNTDFALSDIKIKTVYVACDAGMGSSAMGATILRDKMKKAGLTDIKVINTAIPKLPVDVGMVVTHESLTERARKERPDAIHISVDNFLSSPVYDKIVEQFLKKDSKEATEEATETTGTVQTTEAADKIKKETSAAGKLPILVKSNIIVDGSIRTREEAIHKIAAVFSRDGYADPDYEKGMLLREKEGATNLGNAMAIPHGTLEYKSRIRHAGIAILMVPDGIEWSGETVRLIVGIAGDGDRHLEILSKIALGLQEKSAVEEVVDNRDIDRLYKLLAE